MKTKITGKNIEVTPALKEAVEKKLSKLDKYLEKDYTAHVTLSVERKLQVIEVTIPLKNVILRGEEATESMYASIDLVIDKLEGQMRKNKTKLSKQKYADSLRFYDALSKGELAATEVEEESKIVKTKRFAIKPMNAEEAVLQMELLGHNFFVFMDDETSEVNVVYKRKDGNFGLIEPEFD
ncbi:ribosome hibernation-promoting factor, HPF/YfiA family [Clostridium cellulovorans]|uniref:Ribosome hibernation promoting factor n=1 Tax=Clostridium cellulovorans (strain ATCC 35296 / DSM 3052 / OCM 3 / 743B) TaxID=573061 RepID=D9STJ2_CLOC7|nr:ribosome-associated translation inhibitor RaiA [Clostridium cellulovorans]ADL52726.1 sigma 54 modulation protein/ribosomal protein S30EA [Clostridium cellulovorans 743B]